MNDKAAHGTRLTWRQAGDPAVLLVCGLGSGFAPVAPGTWGSVLAVGMWWLTLAGLGPVLQLVACAVTFGVGTVLVARVQTRHGVGDSGAIVVDEVVGQWLALLAVPAAPVPVLLAFALFRLFDIWKPWPIRLLERRVAGALGVMIDDVVAGVFALAVTQLTLWLVPAIAAGDVL